MKAEEVILVNENDEELGVLDKYEAHRIGALHRAISIFIFNSKGEMLIHKRAINKYHSGGLWTNACCSHPRPNENTEDAAKRRLMEEMGIETAIYPAFTFTYSCDVSNELFEHELDHVFIGYCDDKPNFSPDEVSDYKYIACDILAAEIQLHPDDYTVWFKLLFDKVTRFVSNKIPVN